MEEEKKDIIEVQKDEQTGNTQKIIEPNQTTTQKQSTQKNKKDRKGFCIASMVLGIVAIVCFCLWYIAIPCGILAIIFGILGVKSTNKGMAIAGIITGAIGLLIFIFIIIIFFMYGLAVGFSDAIKDDSNSHRNLNHYYDDWDWYDYD